MKKKYKLWGTGALSAIVATCSGLWPIAASSICANSFCGACSGNCFSGLGLLWLCLLFVRNSAGIIKQKAKLFYARLAE